CQRIARRAREPASQRSRPRRSDLRKTHRQRCRRAAARARRSPNDAARRRCNEFGKHPHFGLGLTERAQFLHSFGELEVAAVEDAVRLPDVPDLLLREPATLQALGVHRVRDRRIARDHEIRRYITLSDRAASEKGVSTNLHVLMHGGKAAQRHPIADLHMAGQGGAVGEDGLVADLTIVRNVRIRHEQIVTANPGDTFVLRSAAIDGAALAKHIAITNLQTRGLALVLLVLRGIPDGGELEYVIVRANDGRPVDHRMRSDHRPGPDLDIRADDREGTNSDVGSELGLRRYDRFRIDHLPVSGATIISACATSVSPTRARVSNFQIPRNARCTVALRINWSPGITGLRKRALSMPT